MNESESDHQNHNICLVVSVSAAINKMLIFFLIRFKYLISFRIKCGDQMRNTSNTSLFKSECVDNLLVGSRATLTSSYLWPVPLVFINTINPYCCNIFRLYTTFSLMLTTFVTLCFPRLMLTAWLMVSPTSLHTTRRIHLYYRLRELFVYACAPVSRFMFIMC